MYSWYIYKYFYTDVNAEKSNYMPLLQKLVTHLFAYLCSQCFGVWFCFPPVQILVNFVIALKISKYDILPPALLQSHLVNFYA